MNFFSGDATAARARRFRYLLVFLSFFESLVIVGLIWAWSPLEVMLIHEGQFLELCPKGVETCAEQKVQLNNIYTAGSTACLITSWIGGLWFDRVGPRICLMSAASLFLAGCALFALSSSQGFHGFTAGYCLIGVASVPSMTCFMSAAYLFPRRFGVVITLLGVATSCGPLVYFALSPLNLTYAMFFKIMSAVACGVLLTALLLLPDTPFPPPPQLAAGSGGGEAGGDGDQDSTQQKQQQQQQSEGLLADVVSAAWADEEAGQAHSRTASSSSASAAALTSTATAAAVGRASGSLLLLGGGGGNGGSVSSNGGVLGGGGGGGGDGSVPHSAPLTAPLLLNESGTGQGGSCSDGGGGGSGSGGSGSRTRRALAQKQSQQQMQQLPPGMVAEIPGSPQPDWDACSDGGGGSGGDAAGATVVLCGRAYPPLDYRHLSLWQQLRHPVFLGIVALFTLLGTAINLYVGTTFLELQATAGGAVPPARLWTLVFSAVYPLASILSVPLTGSFLERAPQWVPIATCPLLVMSVQLCASVPSLPVQALTFCLLALAGSTLFSNVPLFIMTSFGLSTFGTLLGVVNSVAGVCNLSLIPLVSFIVHTLDGQFLMVHLAIASLCIAFLVFPAWLARLQASKAQQQQQRQRRRAH